MMYLAKNGLALAVALLMGACQTRVTPITGRIQVNSVSGQSQNIQAALVYSQTLAREILSPDESQWIRTEEVLKNLVDAVNRYFTEIGEYEKTKSYNWEFNVVLNPEPNAMCFPGGKILVHSGLFDVATTDGQLAAVLGHEIAHALAEHIGERITDAQTAQVLTGVFAAGAMNDQQGAQLYAHLATIGMLLPHSRFQESEADHIGMIIAAMAGYHPTHACDFWENMTAKNMESGLLFMRTHPSREQRLKQLQALEPTVMPIYNLRLKELGVTNKKE